MKIKRIKSIREYLTCPWCNKTIIASILSKDWCFHLYCKESLNGVIIGEFRLKDKSLKLKE
jgi:hypothetical protein